MKKGGGVALPRYTAAKHNITKYVLGVPTPAFTMVAIQGKTKEPMRQKIGLNRTGVGRRV